MLRPVAAYDTDKSTSTGETVVAHASRGGPAIVSVGARVCIEPWCTGGLGRLPGEGAGAQLQTAFLTGGLIIGALVGVIALVVVRLTGLEPPTNLTPHYGLRLGLGIVALVLAAFLPWLGALRRGGAQREGKPSLSTG